MHVQKTIERLGLKPGEVQAYLASLNLGEATISEIAQKAQIPRTSVQIIVHNLQKRGLINFYIKRRRKYWIAENPEKLLTTLKEQEVALKEVLPELQALRHDTGIKPTIKFYSGIDGIKNILNDIIETKHNISSLTSMEDAVMLLSGDFSDFIERRYARHLKVRFLTNRSPDTIALKRRDDKELRHTKFLPDDFKLKNANFIYGDKVAIISLNKKLPVGIIIEDKDIADTQTALFEAVWIQSAES